MPPETSTGDDDRQRRLTAVEREMRRTRESGDERDLVDTVGEEQRRAAERADDGDGDEGDAG